MYIAVLDEVPDHMVPVLVAHAVLGAHLIFNKEHVSALHTWDHHDDYRVWLRDNFKCKIADQNCKGRIEAHHILGWTAYPELRYQLNNGITLCHAHHPRKRAEEKRLIPTFNELLGLVSVSK